MYLYVPVCINIRESKVKKNKKSLNSRRFLNETVAPHTKNTYLVHFKFSEVHTRSFSLKLVSLIRCRNQNCESFILQMLQK